VVFEAARVFRTFYFAWLTCAWLGCAAASGGEPPAVEVAATAPTTAFQDGVAPTTAYAGATAHFGQVIELDLGGLGVRGLPGRTRSARCS